jgi:cell division protein ZapA (FtsZ GTPase activity inhibitor)
MTTYLTIITTVLVLTQILRLYQNSKQLRIFEENKIKDEAIKNSWDKMREAIDKLIEKMGDE